MESLVPKELQTWEKIESLIFEATSESLDEAKSILFPEKKCIFPLELVVRLTVRAALVRPFSTKILADFVKSLGPYLKGVRYSLFTEYCLKKRIFVKLCGYNTDRKYLDKTIEEIEEVFPKDSLFSIIQNGTIEEFTKASIKKNMWTEEAELIGNKVNVLDVACFCGKIDFIKFLLQNGFKITENTRNFVVAGGHLDAVKLIDSIEALNDCLNTAIQTHRNDIAQYLGTKYDNSGISLQFCIESMNTLAFSIYVKTRTNFNDKNFTNELTPVLAAIAYGQVYILDYLLSKGAKLIGRDKDGRTPILLAPYSYCTNMIIYLIKKGANKEEKDRFGQTALLNAVICKNTDAVSLFVRDNANIEAKDFQGSTPYMNAVKTGCVEIANYLKMNKAKTDVTDKNGMTVIEAAVQSKSKEMVEFILNDNIDVNQKTKEGLSLLHVAVHTGNLDIVKLLVEKGISINVIDKNGFTPIFYSAMVGNLDIFKYFYEKGASLEANYYNKNSIISAAVVNGHLDMVKYIISCLNINVNEIEFDGSTIIHKAAATGQVEVLKFLVKYGGNVDILDIEEDTPLNYAIIKGKTESVRLLIEEKADINRKNKKLEMPIHIAAKNNKPEIVKMLVENGSSVMFKDKNGTIPYFYAIQNKNESLANYLKEQMEQNAENMK